VAITDIQQVVLMCTGDLTTQVRCPSMGQGSATLVTVTGCSLCSLTPERSISELIAKWCRLGNKHTRIYTYYHIKLSFTH